jgi:hypothetical protein
MLRPKNFDRQSCNDQTFHHSLGYRKFFVTIFLVCHYDLAIYMKEYLKAKEELWKFQNFTM